MHVDPELSRPRASADALRASVGAVAVLLGALLLAGMLVLLLGDVRAGAERTPAQLRLQLLVQGAALIAGAVAVARALHLASVGRVGSGRVAGRLRLPFGTRGIVAGMAGGLVLALAVVPLIDLVWPELSDPVATVERLSSSQPHAGDLVTVLLLVGLAPLAEETLFRGIIAATWSRAGRPITGLVVSSVIFALAHATVGGRTVVVTLLLGLVLGAALLVTGTLAAPVLIHALFNAVAVFDSEVGHGRGPVVAATIVCVTLIAARMTATQAWARPAGRLRLVNERPAALQPDG